MKMSNELYDFLKDLTTIYLPAFGTLYFALSGIWGFPYGEQVVGTVAAFCAFLGACLKISNVNYKKAQLHDEDILDDMTAEPCDMEDEEDE